MVLVAYANLQFNNSYHNACCGKNDVEALPQTYKRYVRIQNNPFNEKYGYVEIRSRLLWKTLVESRMANDDTIRFDTYSIVPS